MFYIKRKIHFVGIGGAGMSPLAEVMKRNGNLVTGSDLVQSSITDRLKSIGIKIQYNHLPDLVKGADLLVYSSAVKHDNTELIYGKEHGIVVIKRAEMLGDIMRAQFSIGVAGIHGKTTTTCIIGKIFRDADKDPTIIAGGVFNEDGASAVVGNGKILIVEADEYDRSFLKMFPSVAVVTNIEAEHLDVYEDIDDIKKTFIEYIQKVPFFGIVVLCKDNTICADIAKQIDKPVVTYSTSKDADYRADNIEFTSGYSEFDVYKKNKLLGRIHLPLLGMHNIRNALAGISVACEMGIKIDIISKALEEFKGVKRRFEIVGKENNITIINDYAHHPTEIDAVLSATESLGYKRIIAVFQPHLYSRTRYFLNEFARALMKADYAIVTSIYRAREEPINGVSGENIVRVMRENKYSNVSYVESIENLVNVVIPLLKQGDCVLLLGAGNICDFADSFMERLKNV